MRYADAGVRATCPSRGEQREEERAMSKSGGKSGKSGNKSGARRPQRGGAKTSSRRELARMQQRQRERIRRLTMIVGGLIGAVVLIAALAQSFGPAQATTPPGATPTTSVPTSSPIVRQVDVTLTDNAISSSMTSFTTGVQYHFVVHNTATSARDFMIAPPFQNDESMEQMVKAALFHLSAQALTPGTLKSFDFVFDSPATAGQLQLSTPATGQGSTGTHLAITVAQG
jgi:hypothetical protein